MSLKSSSFFIALPVLAVFIGLFLFKDGLVTILTYHGTIFGILLFTRKIPLFKKCLTGFRWIPGSFLILSASLTGLVIHFFRNQIIKDGMDIQGVLTSLGLSGLKLIIFLLLFSIVNPILEEVFWRGFFNKKEKLILADFGFGVYHALVLALVMDIPWIILSYLFLTIVSVLCRHYYNKEKGLLTPVLTHMAADLSILIILVTPVMSA